MSSIQRSRGRGGSKARGGGRPRTARGLAGRLWLTALLLFLLAPAAAQAATLRAHSVLPPGQSGHVSIPGVLSGTGSPHLTDQVDLFNTFNYKPFTFNTGGETEVPRAGVSITRDAYGVPQIRAGSEYDAWWGVGFAVAQDRLFQMEAFKRATSGRLSEMLGPANLADDLIARRDYYTPSEIDRMVSKIPLELRRRTEAYRDGVNAWIDRTRLNPTLLPGEFVALGLMPRYWTVRDTARLGVFLARTVPSGDGNELANAIALREAGPKAFNQLHPVRTPGHRPSVLAREGRFPAQPGRSRADEREGFRRTRRWLRSVDLDAPVDTTRLLARSAGLPEDREPGQALRSLLPSPGGSFMWAISDGRRSFHFNGPQLGYSIPELFVEFELHSPNFPNLRGVTAAGIPIIAAGHNGRVSWGVTSGLSDEDDLYVVRLTGPETYSFRGRERRMSCRNEQLTWNTPPVDLPGALQDLVGGDAEYPPAGGMTTRVCRTRHGPVQALGNGYALARRYAIWDRELETFKGLDMLNKARNVRDVDRAMREVTWNENIVAADDRGGIGYWHPGLHPLKPKRWDERLPFPGDGRAEWRGLLPRERTPHVINPRRGWVANWNNVPSIGWTNGDGPARERMSGELHRVRIVEREVRRVARRPSWKRHARIVRVTGTRAQQRPFIDRAKIRGARRQSNARGRAVIDALMRWNGDYHRTDENGTVDPGVAIFEELKARLVERLIGRYGEGARPLAGGVGSSHVFDISNGAATAMRVLGPRAWARAAEATARRLEARFGAASPRAWREPRRMYRVGAMGAGSAPDLPFFDRGTWEQATMMGRRR